MNAENAFRKDLCDRYKALRGKEIYIQKHHGSQYSSGLPDCLFNDKTDGLAFLELKAIQSVPKKSPILFHWDIVTDLQMRTLLDIMDSGARARVVVFVKPLKKVISYRADIVASLRKSSAPFMLHSASGMPQNGWIDWSTPTSKHPHALRRIVFGALGVGPMDGSEDAIADEWMRKGLPGMS